MRHMFIVLKSLVQVGQRGHVIFPLGQSLRPIDVDQRDIETLMPLSVDPPVKTETEWLLPASETKIDP